MHVTENMAIKQITLPLKKRQRAFAIDSFFLSPVKQSIAPF